VAVFLTLLVVPAVYSIAARKTKSPQYVSKLLDKLAGSRPPESAPVEKAN
jgi:hypothetical protein